ncbi:MAG: flavodoxin reductase [Sphingobacteriales bacterium UTBCD1]|jgi:ferredoxin-NADP reductase|nr:MAG: flavodoxin reductase [Sphingobacteriales bacterium UTBCD1]
MGKTVKIISIEHLTHDVLRIEAEKPRGLSYQPGQAVDLSINKPGWENEIRPFTFTSLPDDDHIEFSIKTYPTHNGVTNQLLSLKAGDELIAGEVFGDIRYKGNGIFIAGGAGVTPFISILRKLEKENKINGHKLIFANKTKSDIIHEDYFTRLLGKNFINILSDENHAGYEHGFISPELLKKYSDGASGYYYLCGPPPMMQAVEKYLAGLGISENRIVREAF